MTAILKSNLELHVDVLHTLEYQHEPRYSNNFEPETKKCGFTLKKQLDFLIRNKLVEKRLINRNQVIYTVTERGKKILVLFQKIADILKLETQNPANWGDILMKIRNDVIKQLRVIRRRIEQEKNPKKKMQIIREYEVLLEIVWTYSAVQQQKHPRYPLFFGVYSFLFYSSEFSSVTGSGGAVEAKAHPIHATKNNTM